MPVDTYREWDLGQEFRYEYVIREVSAIIGGVFAPNDLALHLYTLLKPYRKQKGCPGNGVDTVG